ncbi:MAG TPA: HAMP domain-containing sensor histidine kinase [Chloroflexia bacterium]|nr:HAMP domain-containing sensor histidine kinase [Chloroflexia bacterium]
MLEKARRKLIWWNIGIVVPLIAALILGMYFSISSSIENEISNELATNANNVLQATSFRPTATSNQLIPPTQPVKSSDNRSEEKDDHQQGQEREEGKLELTHSSDIDLLDSTYFLIDRQSNVVANSLQSAVQGLPNLTQLNKIWNGQSYFQEVRLQNGLEMRLYTVPVRIENGQIVGAVQVGKNLSGHKEQLQSVLTTTGIVAIIGLALAIAGAFVLTSRALIPVRQSIERQREFVADASHELRTPLTLIKANAEVALRNPQKTVKENSQYLEDIRTETDYLTRLVSDLLTLARADMGKAELKTEPLELVGLARGVIHDIQPLAEAKNLELKFISPGDSSSELWISADRMRMRQLLVILLDNAIKYTHTGQVSLAIESGRGQIAIIKVSDTGVGISQEQQARIFERFYRADKARSHSEGSYGLGLSIARWIVQAPDGSIQVSSQPGKGSTFSVSLKKLVLAASVNA